MEGVGTIMASMQAAMNSAYDEHEKVRKGNRAAKVRLRGHLQEIKALAQEARAELLRQKPE